MTTCIAAVADHDGKQDGKARIVLCADFLASTKTASSETQAKIGFVENLSILFAGQISAAHELISVYRSVLGVDDVNLELSDLAEKLRIPIHLQKRRLVDSLVRRRTGLSYDEFLSRGDQIESGFRSKVFSEIDQIFIAEELLITGFTSGGGPVLFREAWEGIEYCENFAAVGDGAAAAEQSLYRRRQRRGRDLATTIYNLYEAKKLSEGAPTVGRETVVWVLEPHLAGTESRPLINTVSFHAMKMLEACYLNYGPTPNDEIVIPVGVVEYEP